MTKVRFWVWLLFVLSLVAAGCGSGASSVSGFTRDDDAGAVVDAAPDAGPTVDASVASFAVKVTVAGLSGSGLVLQNGGADDLAIGANGQHVFSTRLPTGAPYDVKVRVQPSSPTQECVVTAGTGTMGGADVPVVVNCATKPFKIGGTVVGLQGTGLVLQNNGGDNLAITGNGPFVFATTVASGAPFAVTVLTQPIGPAQTCVVTGDHGTVTAGDVSSVTVNCATNSFTIGGTVSGLAGTLVLQNDDGADGGVDSLTVNANGAFAFPTPYLSGAFYHVTVKTQPGSPSQTCSFSGGSGDAGPDGGATSATGQVANANVTSIAITCTTNKFTVGGTLTLVAGTAVLQNNGGDALARSANGPFTFATPVASGQTYDVKVLLAPSTPAQSCTVTNGTGTIAAQNVTNVVVTCVLSPCPTGYDNCDNNDQNGCETNLNTDVTRCGSCGNTCTPQNSVGAVCAGGQCGYSACLQNFDSCDNNAVNGCERNISTLTDCGACNQACSPAHAAGSSCTNGVCDYVACSGLFRDCDAQRPNGCERSIATLTDCGGCNISCGYPNAAADCSTGTCAFSGCQTNYWDVDGNLANGCEYACTFQSLTDLPDDTFVDANCDGIDGNANDAIFVATSGNDSNPGTRQAPVATINGGVSKAISTGRPNVYISEGLYDGRVTLANGVSLYGGYSMANGWARSASYVATIRSGNVSGGRVTAVDGFSITNPTVIDRLTITTLSTSAATVSNYAMYCTNCTGVTLKNSVVTAGAAGSGVAGSNGSAGGNAWGGGNGGSGSCDGNTPGGGGPPGGSACGRTGGDGGQGGNYGRNNGAPGGTGVVGTSGGGGGGYGNPGQRGGDGNPGSDGASGFDGAAGVGGSVVGGLWSSANGANGGGGADGNAGGGGGGGGGQQCSVCVRGPGDGGGGGGGGGCGGTGATAGTAGGGSFGLFLVNSTGFLILNNTIESSNGGSGGTGGTGGSGGGGAGGGSGASSCPGEVGPGGNGGSGGSGGRGGHGGGGAGGPSYALHRYNSTVSVAGNNFAHGSGGGGGSSPGNWGASGASANVF